MNRPPFISLAFIAVMLQVMTFGACRPRPSVEVFLPSGIVTSLSSHQHPHIGAHTHDHASEHSPAERPDSHTEQPGACEGHPPESPSHVHLWDTGPVAPRPDRDSEGASLDAPPQLLWHAPLDPDTGRRHAHSAPFVPRPCAAAPGLLTTRLLI